MLQCNGICVVDRREFVLGATAAALLAPVLAEPALAQSKGPENEWQQLLKRILGDATPTEGRIALELPEIAENGNTVPFNVSVESRMTESDHVKAIHLISTANPQPAVATFRFTPASGKASVASRMRLAQTQDVVALAELSDGKFLMARQAVRVTIGGCGG
ncbi:MAG TPA: thiosulfate oxidation carrier protein SoxY [Hyphomicrobiaceae bacterium]|nr:thiosulfate oxidation carrier protein SoxY [Hyphomicrobiaceae bacterium]